MMDDGEVRGLAPFLFGALASPGGIAQGFVSVTLSYVLRRHGVSVAEIAGLVGLNLLPQTWRFLIGPVLDMSLSSARWYMICVAAMLVCLLAMAAAPLTSAATPLLDGLALIMGVGLAGGSSSIAAAMAQTTPDARRGAVAGWVTTGNLGGIGVGGGAGLWLATHAGGPMAAALALIAIGLVCAAPILWVRVPPRMPGVALTVQATTLGRDFWALLRTRRGVLAALVVTIPASLGAASNLFAAVAGDWRASADLVAMVTGVLGGLAAVPGCVLAGYLCDRFPRRIVYIWVALACAAGEAAMAWAPHTPLWFAGMVLGNGLLLGAGYSALSAVQFECLGPRSAATVASVLGSLANLPLVVMIPVVGWVQTRHGSTAMLLCEAGVAVISVAGYAALAYAWRPEAARGLTVAGLAGAEA